MYRLSITKQNGEVVVATFNTKLAAAIAWKSAQRQGCVVVAEKF